ncbi:MAG: hypothetical protein GX046_09965 [Tissierellia bacterium]|nr:hypothetical protein [Tissierellia bacterium]
MKKLIIVLLAIPLVVLLFIAGYSLVEVIYWDISGIQPAPSYMKVSDTAILKQEIIGTWTTEDSIDKLAIRKHYLVYTNDDLDIKETHAYLTKNFDFENESFFLYPSKFNKTGVMGPFEKIEYRDGGLFAGILIHDVDYVEWEFRREW